LKGLYQKAGFHPLDVTVQAAGNKAKIVGLEDVNQIVSQARQKKE